MEKYLDFKEKAIISYSFFPYFQELNDVIWNFFQTQDRPLWWSDVKDIALKTNIDIVNVRCFITCLRGVCRRKDPNLLTELFYYQSEENKELMLLKGHGLRQHAKELGIIEISDKIITDLAFSIFICWHPEPQKLSNPLPNNPFIKDENSLLSALSEWL